MSTSRGDLEGLNRTWQHVWRKAPDRRDDRPGCRGLWFHMDCVDMGRDARPISYSYIPMSDFVVTLSEAVSLTLTSDLTGSKVLQVLLE